MYEDTSYGRHFLKEVIVRIDFVAPLGDEKALSTKLFDPLSEGFPISEPVAAVAQELQITGEGLKPQKHESLKQWNFHGKQREKQLSLRTSFVALTYPRYTAYENLKADFGWLLGITGKYFPEARSRRFGLRYIIKCAQVVWCALNLRLGF
jgi:uncharacterized protein (TIGR04255 family)